MNEGRKKGERALGEPGREEGVRAPSGRSLGTGGEMTEGGAVAPSGVLEAEDLRRKMALERCSRERRVPESLVSNVGRLAVEVRVDEMVPEVG